MTDTTETTKGPGVEILRLVLRYAHLIGFAMLLGGAVVQWMSARFRINPAMLWGAVIQLATGVALAAPLRGGGDAEPGWDKLGVKLVLAIMIFVMVFFSRRRTDVNRGHFLGIVVLTLLNAAVATFWR